MAAIPTLEIYRNRQTGAFALLNYVPDPNGWQVATGDLMHLSEEKMRSEGLTALLRNLRESKTRTLSELERMGPTQAQAFKRQHDLVAVDMRADNELILDPLFPGREGGHRGRVDGGIPVKLPCDNAIFLAKLLEAFQVCGGGTEEMLSELGTRSE